MFDGPVQHATSAPGSSQAQPCPVGLSVQAGVAAASGDDADVPALPPWGAGVAALCVVGSLFCSGSFGLVAREDAFSVCCEEHAKAPSNKNDMGLTQLMALYVRLGPYPSLNRSPNTVCVQPMMIALVVNHLPAKNAGRMSHV
jgi:hypothetical protein